MTNGPRCKTNKRLRMVLDEHVQHIPLNTSINVGEISAMMTSRRTPVDSRSVGRFLAERQDMVKIRSGVWQRVSTCQ